MFRDKTLVIFAIFALLASIAYAVQISPALPLTTDNLNCTHGDNPSSYLYYWYESGTQIDIGMFLDNDSTSRGDIVVCQAYIPATPWTGEVYVGEAQVMVGNQPPVLNPLPDQNIDEDSVLGGNLFDLDDYGSDPDNDS